MAGYGDGSDGALNITSGSYSLHLNQKYQFTSINISSGATLTTSDTSGAVMYLLCQGTCTIAGSIDLHNLMMPGDNSWECTIEDSIYSSPGVAPGGPGGNSVYGPNAAYIVYGGSQNVGFGGGGAGGGVYWPASYPGSGGNGSSSGGIGGAAVSASVVSGQSKAIVGNSGGASSGGSGGLFLQYAGSAGYTTSGTSGAGGSAYGNNGTGTSHSTGGNPTQQAILLGGGGGAGGIAGKSGVHLVIMAQTIIFTGTVNTNGTNGGSGGAGGSGYTSYSAYANPGASGGGGGGGNAGNIYLIANDTTIDGQTSMSGGTGGKDGSGNTSGSIGSDGTLYLTFPTIVDDDKLLFLSSWDIDQLVLNGTISIGGAGTTKLIDYSTTSLPGLPVFDVQFQPSGSSQWFAPGTGSTDGTLSNTFSFYHYIYDSSLYIYTNGAGKARYYIWSDKVDY